MERNPTPVIDADVQNTKYIVALPAGKYKIVGI
jgi:hypothetical protein